MPAPRDSLTVRFAPLSPGLRYRQPSPLAPPDEGQLWPPRSSWVKPRARWSYRRLPRLSQLPEYPWAAGKLDEVFTEKTTLPPRWSFYLPDFEFSVEDFEKDEIDPKVAAKGFRVSFAPGDPKNPKNWSTPFRILIVAMFSYTTLATGIYSTAYSSGISDMEKDLHITNTSLPPLGISLYLVGLALGAIVMAPLSETFGRRPMYVGGLSVFMALIPVAALANNLTQVLVARFFGAIAGSVMLSNASGSIIDITAPKYLPLALSVLSFGPLNGPVLGPLISGFVVQASNWRILNWMALGMTAPGALFIMALPETHMPTILRKMVKQKCSEENDDRYWCDFDDTIPLGKKMVTAVSRPFVLSFTEPVLLFWNIYISVIYAIVQLAYIAYPIIYEDIRGLSVAIGGLAFLGVFLGIALVLLSEPFLRRLVNSHSIVNPETKRLEPEGTVFVICIGAVLEPLAQFWFAFTSVPASVPIYWSILSGIPFGYGFGLIFIYGTNYLSNVFGMYATSATAGNLIFRSLLGAILVVTGKSMYAALTPRGAGLFLAVLEVVLMPVPFLFYKWGKKIRQKSRLIHTLEEQAKKVA